VAGTRQAGFVLLRGGLVQSPTFVSVAGGWCGGPDVDADTRRIGVAVPDRMAALARVLVR